MPVTNPLERLNAEIKGRTDVVGMFPNEPAITRKAGALLLEQNDEWQLQRRYLPLEGLQALADNQPARLSAVVSWARVQPNQKSRIRIPRPGTRSPCIWPRLRCRRLVTALSTEMPTMRRWLLSMMMRLVTHAYSRCDAGKGHSRRRPSASRTTADPTPSPFRCRDERIPIARRGCEGLLGYSAY